MQPGELDGFVESIEIAPCDDPHLIYVCLHVVPASAEPGSPSQKRFFLIEKAQPQADCRRQVRLPQGALRPCA